MKSKGQAAILIIFVLGMISVSIAISLVKTGYLESMGGRGNVDSTKAFYAANSGVEQAFYEIQKDNTFQITDNVITIEDGEAKLSVTNKTPGVNDIKIVTSSGKFGNYTRRIKTEIQNSTLKPGFLHAVHADIGGFEIEGKALVTSSTGEGNVFSNGDIKGKQPGDCTGTSISEINGSAWAVGSISKLQGGSGMCIRKDAHAKELLNCYILGNRYYSDSISDSNCGPITSPKINESVPSPIPLPDMGLNTLKAQLEKKGNIYSGNCVLGSGIDDCSKGTNIIGDLIIDGNLTTFEKDITIYISGPVWIKGNFDFSNNNIKVKLADSITEPISQILLSDGKIITQKGAEFNSKIIKTKKTYILFIAEYAPTIPMDDWCTSDPSIDLKTNSQSALFYATKGCVNINTESESTKGYFYGSVIGKKILLNTNSALEYDPDLATAIFGLTKSGGWVTNSFEEF